MKRVRIRAGLASGLGATALLASAAFAATGTNGSFETGTYNPEPVWAPHDFDTVMPNDGDSVIGDWTVGGDSVDWVRAYWQAADGNRSIDLSGNAAGSVSQTFPTEVGSVYTVTFKLSGNPDGVRGLKTGTVQATGAPSQALTFDTLAVNNTHSDMKWTNDLYTFMATTPNTTLTFLGTTASPYGLALDDVQIQETLLNAASCKKDGWKTMKDFVGNYFKNQGDCVSFYATDGTNVAAGGTVPPAP